MPAVVLMSDTHVPSRAPELPDWVREAVAGADHVVHAGDFDSQGTYDLVRSLADDLTAVRGNTDPPTLPLPDVATLTVGDATLVVTHGDGPSHTYEERVARIAREEGGPDAVAVSGHTHRPADTTVDGTRLLNPGSATGATPAFEATLYEFDPETGEAALRHGPR